MIELLAPAGDLERVKIALYYGADAVYSGGSSFNLRANAKNLTKEELEEAVNYVHEKKKKIYITVNIVFHDNNFEGLDEYLQFLEQIKIDGIIASDIAVIKRVKELGLNIPLCLSTQASTLNARAVRFWQSLGVTRVVLAREASRENIKRIKEETGIEIETFIHGAMCTSFSGKCVLSNYITNRDSNRGGCAQICRWHFQVDDQADLTITPKDLNMIPFIQDEIEIGVDSFKVEGRMRSIYYVATVILCYRRLIDGIMNKTLKENEHKYYLAILNRCANRESTPQFYDKLPTKEEQYYQEREELSNQDFLGLVIDYDQERKLVKLEQRNYFKKDDIVQFFGPSIETFTYKINKILNEDGEEIDVARHPQQIVYLPIEPLPKFTMMRLKTFDKRDFL